MCDLEDCPYVNLRRRPAVKSRRTDIAINKDRIPDSATRTTSPKFSPLFAVFNGLRELLGSSNEAQWLIREINEGFWTSFGTRV